MADIEATRGIGSGGLGLSSLETNVNEVNEMVKLIGCGGMSGSAASVITESQTCRLVAYLGNLEEMRAQLATMIQHYADDEKVLHRLISLFESVDGTLTMVNNTRNGYAKPVAEGGEGSEQQEDVVVVDGADAVNNVMLSNSLKVSHVNMLGVSGLKQLFGDEDKDNSTTTTATQMYQGWEEEEEESLWDIPITEEDMAGLDLLESISPPSLLVPSSLRASVVIPTEEQQQPTTTATSPPSQLYLFPSYSSSSTSSSSSSSYKGKKKETTCEPVTCKICYESFTQLAVLHTLKCGHIYCAECLTSLLDVLVEQGAVLDLCCPQPGCGEEIGASDVALLSNETTFAKYERFVLLAALRADPNVRWCPLPTCSTAVKGPPIDGKDWLVCTACALHICFKCGEERHDPAKCGKEAHELLASRHSNMVEAQLAFTAWRDGMKERVKQCPGCKGFIEKNQGCNHMTCKACKYQFCWLCGMAYASGHFNDSVKYPECNGKQYWVPPTPPDPDLAAKYNWIYFPPNYQYANVDTAAKRKSEKAKKIKKIGVYVGVGVAVATLGVPAAIIGGPIYGVFKLHKRLKAKKARRAAEQRVR